jgi:flagellar biosynthesis protein FlhF
MDVKTFRAGSMQEALSLVRHQLGPDAAVLHTREVSGGLLRWLAGKPLVEITATTELSPPRRLARRRPVAQRASLKASDVHGVDLDTLTPTGLAESDRPERPAVYASRPTLRLDPVTHLPESLFRVFADLIDADVHEELARTLIEQLHRDMPISEVTDDIVLKARLARMIEDEIRVSGPIQTMPGRRRLVALVGPTGVGKTTTIAKLAANSRLKERKRVGLITVDTFRIAAVEQLRAYADIIDLPMEVVSNPSEMRHAIARLADLDLVLMDTAGRSPRDEVKLQELKAMFAEAAPDEVHLVLSATYGASILAKMAERFAEVGTTALLLTKVDETHGLGNLLPLVRASRVPLSYITNGQNVPDDIEAADATRLAQMMIGLGK